METTNKVQVNLSEHFLPMDLAQDLIAKGFNEKCIAFFNPKGTVIFGNMELTNGVTYIDAPLVQQATEWLLEEHELNIVVEQGVDKHKADCFDFKITRRRYDHISILYQSMQFRHHRDALLEAISEALELI